MSMTDPGAPSEEAVSSEVSAIVVTGASTGIGRACALQPADAVEHALTASRARLHSTVGRNARIARVRLALLPKRAFEWIIAERIEMGVQS